jgi:flagella basal body P-ring formation protein FlgA
MSVEPRTGRFEIAFELPGSVVSRRAGLRFTGSVSETVEAATLTRALRLGEIVKASDVSVERRPKLEVRGDGLAPSQVIGLAAKAPLRTGQVLRTDDLIKPLIVSRNEAVTIYYEVPGIMLTVRGKALEAGAVGDVVGVLNIQSNRTVQATVIGPGRVTIAAAGPLRVSAATSESDEPTSSRTQ